MKNSNKILFLLVFIIIVSVSVYLFANCIKHVPNGQFAVYKDKTTGDIKFLSPGTHFIIQGLYPGRILLQSYNEINNSTPVLKIDIPPFESSSKLQCIKIACNISYAVNHNIQVSGIQLENINYFNDIIERIITVNIKAELFPYIIPYYKPENIAGDTDKIIERALNRSKQHSEGIGLEIRKFELIGRIESPQKESYYNELKHFNELRDIEKNNKKELLILENKLLNEQKYNSAYFSKLNEISKLIKENPDLLKYMYIEKLADNVKVIIASDRTGFPSGLTGDGITGKDNKNEIDNLK